MPRSAIITSSRPISVRSGPTPRAFRYLDFRQETMWRNARNVTASVAVEQTWSGACADVELASIAIPAKEYRSAAPRKSAPASAAPMKRVRQRLWRTFRRAIKSRNAQRSSGGAKLLGLRRNYSVHSWHRTAPRLQSGPARNLRIVAAHRAVFLSASQTKG